MNAPANTASLSSGNAQQALKLKDPKEEQKCRHQERWHEFSRGTWERVRQQKPGQQSLLLATRTMSLRSPKS